MNVFRLKRIQGIDWMSLLLTLAISGTVIPFWGKLSMLYYPLVALLFLYASFFRKFTVDTALVLFVILSGIGIGLSKPDPLFHSWARLCSFALVVGVIGPLVQNEFLYKLRKTVFGITIGLCLIVGIASFIGYFFGVNMMTVAMSSGAGTFGGVTTHSMILAPMSSIGGVFCFWKLLQMQWKGLNRELILWGAIFISCLACVLMAASRSSFMAMVASCLVIFYHLKKDNLTKLVNSFLLLVVILVAMLPVILPFAENLITKQEQNLASGGTTSSRDSKWNNRLAEFDSSPLWGVGFAAVDTRYAEDYDRTSGIIEFGSSWFALLSMTGLLGTVAFLVFFSKIVYSVYFARSSLASFFLGLLAFFSVHMIAEGYICASGGFLFFLLWISLGVMQASLETDDSMIFLN